MVICSFLLLCGQKTRVRVYLGIPFSMFTLERMQHQPKKINTLRKLDLGCQHGPTGLPPSLGDAQLALMIPDEPMAAWLPPLTRNQHSNQAKLVNWANGLL